MNWRGFLEELESLKVLKVKWSFREGVPGELSSSTSIGCLSVSSRVMQLDMFKMTLLESRVTPLTLTYPLFHQTMRPGEAENNCILVTSLDKCTDMSSRKAHLQYKKPLPHKSSDNSLSKVLYAVSKKCRTKYRLLII